MGTRHLSLALIVAATLLAGRALAQESGLPPQEEQALERAQFVERYDAFLTAWEEAGDEARERVLALFDAEERFARELDPLPASDQVVHGTRLLRGERTGPLSRFADALALRLIPGVLEAEEPSDRPRNPLRVVIYRRWEEAVPESARLVLWQLGPRGEVERLRDKALSDGFFDDGLEVWIVRAPRSAPGRYSYVLEVHGEEGAVRTPPTPLEVVADLEERSKRVEDPRRRRDLARLLSFGVRLPGGVEPLLGERPSSERELPGARTLVSGSASAPVVLLVAGEGERPEELLSGERGERWRDAARGGGFDVVCVALEQVVGASLGATLADRVLLVWAEADGRPLAGALNLIGEVV